MFHAADHNRDHVVDWNEHNQFFNEHHPMRSAAGDTNQERIAIFERVDLNCDGVVQLQGQ